MPWGTACGKTVAAARVKQSRRASSARGEKDRTVAVSSATAAPVPAAITRNPIEQETASTPAPRTSPSGLTVALTKATVESPARDTASMARG